jgi:uncharacterized protein YegL
MNYFPWASASLHSPRYSIKTTIKPNLEHVNNLLKDDNNTMPVTLDGFYKIVLILDESGSMESIRNDMLKSINDLIKEQQQVKERPTTFTLVKFSDKVNRYISNKPLNNIKLLSSEDYTPNGSTALYDAIGDTINWFRNEKDVLMVIVTDGQENSSTKYNKQQINTMIEQKKETNNWSYVYLSNDLSTKLQGNNIGLHKSDYATNYQVERESFGKYISQNLNYAITNCRQKGVTVQSQLNIY